MGVHIRDLHDNDKKDPTIIDKYRPPGIVKVKYRNEPSRNHIGVGPGI